MSAEPLASVLVPTHDHGPTLRHSVAAALGQTVSELELLIVGDGMPAAAAEVARELAAADGRVRVFEFEKGERHGEAHRHAVLDAEARGRFILYLSDDDLWLPEHAERMIAALEHADFVASTAVMVLADGSFGVIPHDLSRPETRALMLTEPRHYNRVGLSAAGHTLAAYRRREQGWSPAPAGLWTDLHFWRGFVADESFTCRSLDRVTVLNFASPVRAELDPNTRAAELQAWAERISEPGGREAVDAGIDAAYRANAVVQDLEYRKVHDWLLDAQRLAGDLGGRGDRLEREAARSQAQVAALEAHVRRLEALPELRPRRSRLGRAALGAWARLRRPGERRG